MQEPTTQRERPAETTRITPYELAFGEAGLEERVFPAIEAEADRLGVDAGRLDMFLLLGSASRALGELVPPEAATEALEQHRLILFQVFNFWRFGKRLYLVETAVARYLVEGAPSPRGGVVPVPARSLYVQLPANLFWASIAPDVPPEPVDGFFVTAFDGDRGVGASWRHLQALLVLGIRRDRAGFSIIPVETESGAGIATDAADPEPAEGRRDFQSALPGGEMAGLYSILTVAEALKLVSRVLGYLDAAPAAVVREEPLERPEALRPTDVRFSRLPFFRVALGGGAGDPQG